MVLAFTGCDEAGIEAYLYVPAIPCHLDDHASSEKCDKLTVGQKITIKVSSDRQEVVYLLTGLKANDGSSKDYRFTKLDGCRVIDKNNFSCDGLERLDGRFTNIEALPAVFVSVSQFLHLTSYLRPSLSKGTLDYFAKYDPWISEASIVLVTLLIVGGVMASPGWFALMVLTGVFWWFIWVFLHDDVLAIF